MAADDDGLLHLAELLEQVANFDAGARVKSAGGFVEQQHLRLVQQHASEADALRLSARQLIDHRVSFECHVNEFEFVLADLSASGAVDAIGGGEEFEVLDDGHVVVHAEEVGHEANQATDFLRVGVDRLAADVRLAVIRREQRRQHAHRCGLARTVGADESEDVTLGQLEVDVVDGDQVAVAFRELIGFDHGVLVSLGSEALSVGVLSPSLSAGGCAFGSSFGK